MTDVPRPGGLVGKSIRPYHFDLKVWSLIPRSDHSSEPWVSFIPHSISALLPNATVCSKNEIKKNGNHIGISAQMQEYHLASHTLSISAIELSMTYCIHKGTLHRYHTSELHSARDKSDNDKCFLRWCGCVGFVRRDIPMRRSM